MADITSYENKYRRYLEDDVDTYLKPEPSTTEKVITGGVAAVGLIGGGLLAYKNGLFKDFLHSAILKAGQYRQGKVTSINRAVRRFSEDKDLDKLDESVRQLFRGELGASKDSLLKFTEGVKKLPTYLEDGISEHQKRVKELSKSRLIDREFEAHQQYSSMMESLRRLNEQGADKDTLQKAQNIMEEVILKSGEISAKEQELKLKQTGFRFATIEDLIKANEISDKEEFVLSGMEIFRKARRNADEFLKTKADNNILIDEIGNIVDLRDLKNTFSGFINSLATDFTIPLIKINPLRMFYIDHFFNTQTKPKFFVSSSNTRQPVTEGHHGAVGKPLLFADGGVYEFAKLPDGTTEAVKREGEFFLADAKRGPVARLIRNMSGITISKFDKPSKDDPLLQRVKYNLGSLFDVGFQDEPPARADLLDPTSWGQGIINKVTGHLRQHKYAQQDDYLSEAFGADAEFIFMRRYRTVSESESYKDYLSQFTAGRKNMEDVTMATLFPYGFFERLNATLNQVNLGLSNEALGNAFDVFSGLLLKRIAPIWAGMELWDYINYESENLLGEQVSDRLAKMYVNTSVELAEVRDSLGITDWAKEVSPLFVGGEQITELPIIGGIFNLDDSAEETERFWLEGEVPVRKGRWWPLGNTPYTGMSIDYWQPNWVRRVLSDYEYSDSLYGSREEYFENSWMPTPRHPLAPIRHFLTDPYHWEEKHYFDRPYPVTGGIPELENFPLVGPLLNSTIGQLLKPTRVMHPEVMQQSEQFETDIGVTPVVDGQSVHIPTALELNQEAEEQQESTRISQEEAKAIAGEVVEGGDQPTHAYVTSSGQTQLVTPESNEALYESYAMLQEHSPMRTGQFKVERTPEPSTELTSEMAMNPMGFQQSLANLHYNVSEMGGFYGFVGVSITGEMYEDVPVLARSSDMTSYSRAFWDLDIGGFGGDANEIFRRFLPKDRRVNEINPIPNTMPDWLPGGNYFIDFQHGDPYAKVKKGEMRLPGEGYERLYGIELDLDNLSIGASFIGYDENRIREHMLKEDAYKSESLQKILKSGSQIHKDMEKSLHAQNVIEKSEQYVQNEEMQVGGFYDMYGTVENLMNWMDDQPVVEFKFYVNTGGSGDSLKDFFVPYDILSLGEEEQAQFQEWFMNQYGQQKYTGDIKTRGSNAWEKEGAQFENVQQVNFYASELDTPINFIIEVNRDDPNAGIKVFAFEQNQNLLDYSFQKVEGVRNQIRQEIENGQLHRGNLYDPIDRFRILADVAPYSEEYRQMKAQIRNMGLSDDELEEVREIEKQVQMRKQKTRMYDYRFKTANLEDELVTVDRVIDANTFIAKEYPNNPIRLAGLRISTAQDSETGQEAARIVRQSIREGAKVRIAYDADPLNKVKDDTYQTIQSVVYDQKGRNLNYYLLEQGLATEKDGDWSPAAVHARFTPNEIAFGAAWEEFAHMDTMIHTKMLQVRSPLESYERREVYGKDWQEWQDPIEDFLIPAIQNAMTHNPILIVIGGGLIGAAFGSLKPSDLGGERVVGRYGKIMGGAIGASTMALAVGYKMLTEAITGEAWIPERRQQERDVEEYFDVLKYIKYNALFERYAQMAKEQEGFDVKEYLQEKESEGEFRQKKIEELEEIKRRLYVVKQAQVREVLDILAEQFGIHAKSREEAMKMINAELKRLQNHREMQPLTPLASRAILYKQASKQTMYGYEAGDPVSNILAALPKKDREYLVPFINAPEEERARILEIVPDYMKRPLQSAWGLPVDQKERLQEYFRDKPLPSRNWAGWDETISLDEIKVKYVDRVGLDPSEFDIWPTDQARAEMNPARVPDIENGRETAETFIRKMKGIFEGDGFKNIDVEVMEDESGKYSIEMQLSHNRQREIQDLINREGLNVI